MIDLAELKKTRAECARKWREDLPTEECRQALLAADAALNDAIKANEVDQIAIDEKYCQLSAKCFRNVSEESLQMAREVYEQIVKLTNILADEQAAADAKFDECKRLFSSNPPSQKVIAKARDMRTDVYGCMVGNERPVDVYMQVSHALAQGNRPYIRTAYLTPRPRKNGVGNSFDLEEERAIQELQSRQMGPR